MLGLGLLISTRASTRDAAGADGDGHDAAVDLPVGLRLPARLDAAVLLATCRRSIPTTWLIDAARGVILRGAGWAGAVAARRGALGMAIAVADGQRGAVPQAAGLSAEESLRRGVTIRPKATPHVPAARRGPYAARAARGRARRMMDRAVKIYLLSIDRRRFFFYADESEPPDDRRDGDGPPGGGASGWLRDRWQRLQSVWGQSEARAVRWSRKAWDWMHSWAHPDEAMLSQLRSARRIELNYPAARRRRGPQAMGRVPESPVVAPHPVDDRNGLVAPPALATLWLLPGPNVIGYWFAYRAVHHA